MAVGSGTPYNLHTGNGVTVTFGYTFTLLDAADLVVRVAGVVTTAYTVSGLGSPSGGAVTFTTAPANGASVELLRVIGLTRLTDYQNNGDLLAPTLNADFDRLWMAVQGVDYDNAASVRAPFPEQINELPAAAARAERLLGFDGTGQPVAVVPDAQSAAALATALASAGPGEGTAMIQHAPNYVNAAARFLHLKLGEWVSVTDFGAIGDGVANDTDALNNAFASGARLVVGVAGHTYLVRHTGTVSINGTAYRYCVRVPSGVTADGCGATIKSDDAQNSTPLAMFSSTDCAAVDWVIDCNRSAQTTPGTGEIAAILVYANTRPVVDNIRAIECRQYAGRFLANTGGRYDRLVCTGCDADGWSFGTNGTAGELREFDCHVGSVHAEACTQAYGSGYQGNPVIVTAVRSMFGRISGKDCAGGLKLQDSCEDVTVGQAVFKGMTNGSVNSGLKIQGNSGAGLYPKAVIVGQVVCTNTYGNGLRITSVESCAIGSYFGRSNGGGATATGSDKYDVYVDTTSGTGSKTVQIDAVNVDSPTTVGINTLGTGSVNIDRWMVRGATGTAWLDSMGGGTLHGGPGRVIDVSSTLTYAFRSTGAAAGSVGVIDCNAAHSTTQPRVQIALGNYLLSVGPVRLAGGALEGIVTLTNAATSTTVANGSAWRTYVGGTSDYVHPDIQITPIGASARALGSMYVVVEDGSTGTGFAIKHATAGASDRVRYKIGPMTVWSAPTT